MPVFSLFSISGSLGLLFLNLVEGRMNKEGSVFLHREGRKNDTSFLMRLAILYLNDSL